MKNADAQKFIEKNKDTTVSKNINLTMQQIDMIEGLANASGLEFKDMAMILMEYTLISMDDAAGEFMTLEIAKRN